MQAESSSYNWEADVCMCNKKGFILSEALLLLLLVSLLVLLSGQCVFLYQRLQSWDPIDKEVEEAYEEAIIWPKATE